MKKTLCYILSLALLWSFGAVAAEEGGEEGAEAGNPANALNPEMPPAGPPQNNLLPGDRGSTIVISRRQASDLAREQFQGRILSIRMGGDGQWRVRLDQEGTVFNVFVDSRSGDITRSID